QACRLQQYDRGPRSEPAHGHHRLLPVGYTGWERDRPENDAASLGRAWEDIPSTWNLVGSGVTGDSSRRLVYHHLWWIRQTPVPAVAIGYLLRAAGSREGGAAARIDLGESVAHCAGNACDHRYWRADRGPDGQFPGRGCLAAQIPRWRQER